MLSKANRLRHWRDFEATYKSGIRRRTPHLTLTALELKSTRHSNNKPLEQRCQQPTRVGIVVGGKVSKKATIRNRIKRRLRACLRQLLPQLLPGWQLVIGARPAAIECQFADFLQELEQLLADAEVLNGNSRRGVL